MRTLALSAFVFALSVSPAAADSVAAGNKADLGLITGSINAPEAKTESEQYCVNITDKAADARFAWQAKTIGDLEKEIDKRIEELDAKRAEYQQWLAQRDEMLAKAEGHVVQIYAKLRPDAAALQLSALDDDIAAALLSKLSARNASAILAEMEPGRAAQLTKAIVRATKVPNNVKDAGKKS
jgi:flagellar motility protein MotE (MotC chaperone)